MACQTENPYEDRLVDAIYATYLEMGIMHSGQSAMAQEARAVAWRTLNMVCEEMGLRLNAVIEECEEGA